MFRIFAVAIVLATLINPAIAQEVTLKGLGGSTSFVWKSKEAHDEALSLIQAGVHKSNPILVMRLLACMPTVGTHAIITDAGIVTHDILITDGPDAGCRGNVAAEEIRN